MHIRAPYGHRSFDSVISSGMESSSSPEGADGASSSDVAHFVSLTSCPVEQAAFFLEATNGNFDQAVEMYYDQAPPSSTTRAAQAYPTSSPQRIPRPPPPPQQPPQPMQQRRGLLGALMNLPIVAITGSFGLLFGAIGLSATAAAYLGSQLLPAPWYNRIRGGIRAITLGSRPVDPVEAAEAFKQSFVKEFGENGPQWVTVGWQEATARAHGQYKFLFVYLHSHYHQDTEVFCRQTLCNSDLAHYINHTFVSWGGDVRYPDAYKLSNSLRTTAYPYVALLAFSGNRTKLIVTVEGRSSASQLQTALQQAVAVHEGHLAVEQADANERNFTRRLREEQDAAYQESLREDQERERQRSAQRAQQEAAERAAAEKAAQIKAAQDAEAKKVADRAAMLAARRVANRAALKQEPAARSPGSTALRVRLPNGSNHNRTFASAAPLQLSSILKYGEHKLCLRGVPSNEQEAWDWVASLEEVDAVKFHLASSFPRKVFMEEELRSTLEQLGLAPQAALFVQVADDE